MEDQLLFWLFFVCHKIWLQIQLGRTYALGSLYFRYLKRIIFNNINPYLDLTVYLVFLLQYYGIFHWRTLLRNQSGMFWIQLFVFEHCILEKKTIGLNIRKYNRFVEVLTSIAIIYEYQRYKFLIYRTLKFAERIFENIHTQVKLIICLTKTNNVFL